MKVSIQITKDSLMIRGTTRLMINNERKLFVKKIIENLSLIKTSSKNTAQNHTKF